MNFRSDHIARQNRRRARAFRPLLDLGHGSLERLESRKLLATVSASGSAPNLSLDIALATNDVIGITSAGTSYAFNLTTGSWSGSAAGATISGATLTLTDLANYSTVNIVLVRSSPRIESPDSV